MDAPAARYTTTSDGVSIAWAEIGQGKPLLYCGMTPFTHVQELFTVFEPYYEGLARSFRLVTFDARGTGMSDRAVADVSTDTLLWDAEAVIDAAKIDRFVVVADLGLLASWTALRLASELPARVTHVVLVSPIQNMSELADTPYGRVGLALAEADWTVYTQTVFRVLGGQDASDSPWVDPIARAAAGWVAPSLGLQYVRLWEATDVGDLLEGTSQPTLVLRGDPGVVPALACQRVAAKIPGAQFQQYADPDYMQWAELIRSFAGSSAPARPVPAPVASSGVRTVLFTDLVGHTEMMRRLGDARGREVLREHEGITRDAIKRHGGAEIKTDGDSFMVSFGSVASAMQCAVALQRAFAARNETANEPLRVRIGLNAGEPIEDQGDLFGETVILASRIASQADAGEILIAEPVRHLLAGKGFVFADRGQFVPKGFEDAVRLFEVRWRE